MGEFDRQKKVEESRKNEQIAEQSFQSFQDYFRYRGANEILALCNLAFISLLISQKILQVSNPGFSVVAWILSISDSSFGLLSFLNGCMRQLFGNGEDYLA